MLASDVLNRIADEFDTTEVFLEESKEEGFELKNAKDFSKQLTQKRGIGIRAVKNNKLIFGYTSLTDKPNLDQIIDDLKKASRIVKDVDAKTIPQTSTTIEEKAKKIELDEKLIKDKLNEISSNAMGFDKRIKEVKSASIGTYSVNVQIANSYGLNASYSKTHVSSAIEVLAEDKISDLGYYALDGDSLEAIDFDFLYKKASSLAINKLYPTSIDTKKYSIIISNNTFRDILAHFIGAFNAYSVINQTTPFEDKLNEQVFSENITIIDAKRIERRPNSMQTDDEGIERADTVVVENGILKTFLHNTYTSNKLNMPNTSNAKRGGFDSMPKVGPFNLYIKPDKATSRDRLLNMIDGIYIIDVMGLHMANPISGDFSLGINGFLVHNGELVSYFKAATFADNFYEIIKRIIAISDNLYFLGSIGSPDVAIADCVIGG
ncbi:TldD/PmbA family protein [Hippea sp. KM1]|uniref:TldD/PmbA family protein n=1 Tax=Hippea sp. KM1 TaxID=944481 RepID=UPI00046D8542|nr:TldD/PmbA family protein [Hippea sp. KM1]